jgi:hypothetical protein
MEAIVIAHDQQFDLVTRTIARIRAGIAAVVVGMVVGFGLFVATLWLVIKGGPNVGQNLGLLRAYFPGYSVTWYGSIIGLIYGAVTGAILGWSVSTLYNLFAIQRMRRR